MTTPDRTGRGPRRPLAALGAVAATLGLYAASVAAATWPFVLTLPTRLPSLTDPLQHLWVMRWYRACLLEGRSPLVCPGLHYPVGASIGNFSPLHLQSIIYLCVSAISENDVFRYNVVWFSGFLLTGMGTYALARHVVGDEGGARLAGLLAMLSGPVLVHSHAHTELIFVGGFPLFMLAWTRFVDRPTPGRMAAAVGGFVLVTMCAAYFMVFAIFPAALYLAWKAAEQGGPGRLRWIGARLAWVAGFSAAALPILALLFAGQVADLLDGRPFARPRSEFDRYAAPWWGYLAPGPGHRLAGALPFDPYATAGVPGEGMAYLGVVTLLLLHRAWVRRVRFRDSGFWWAAAALLAVLSLGSALPFGEHRIGLPAGWLRDCEWFVPFRLIRVPARFKLFVPVCTALIAGAAWADLRSRWKRPALRRLGSAAVVVLVVLDLSHVPYGSVAMPEVPGAYAWLLDRDPDAAWVDVPHMTSSNANDFHARLTYWQSIHRGRTTAGYSGKQNHALDDLLGWNTPFADGRLAEPGYPKEAGLERFDVVFQADFVDTCRLYLREHGLRYVVVHRRDGEAAGFDVGGVTSALEHASIYDDGAVAIFDGDRLRPPAAPVPLCAEGWGTLDLLPRDGFVRLARPAATVAYDNPTADEPLVFAINARAFERPRRVRLMSGREELAAWTIEPGTARLHVSPPFRLPEGPGRLRLVSDGAVPADRAAHRFERETGPVSLIVSGICLRPLDVEEAAAPTIAAGPGDPSEDLR